MRYMGKLNLKVVLLVINKICILENYKIKFLTKSELGNKEGLRFTSGIPLNHFMITIIYFLIKIEMATFDEGSESYN